MKAPALFTVMLVLIVLGFSARAQASPVKIDDLLEGVPIVTAPPNSGIVVDTANEFAHFSTASENPNNFKAPGSYYVLLTEPSDGSASDVVQLVLGIPTPTGPNGLEQPVDVFFYSDGAAGFATALSNALAALAPTVAETGNFQDMSVLLGFPANSTFDVRSDVDTVPEPASLLLLGSGLFAGVRHWRKRLRNSPS